MNPFRTGKLVLFQVSYDRDWHYFEIPAYVLIGIFGVSWSPCSKRWSEAKANNPKPGTLRRLRHQVQSASSRVPQKAFGIAWHLRSCNPGCAVGDDWLL